MRPRFSTSIALLGAALATAPASHAADGTWGTTFLGGTVAWNDAANWTGGIVADGVGASATFTQDLSANLQFSFSSPITIGTISVVDTSTTNPDRGVWFNSGTLTFASTSGTPSISADATLGNHDIPIRFNGATFTGTQGLSLTLTGSGYNGNFAGARFTSGNWSGFSGPVTLQSGRFRVEGTNNTLPPNSEFIINPGVWFQIVRGFTSGLGSQTIRGLSGGDATSLLGCENAADSTTWAATLTLGATALAGDTYTFGGTLGGDIFGTGANTNFSVTKTGPGTQRLNGSSLYAGTTNVTGGTLLVNGTHTQGAGTNAGRYLVGAAGTLGGSGTVVLSDASASLTGFSISGTFAPGDPAVDNGLGTFTINATNSARGALAFETGGVWAVDLGAANTADRIALTGATAGEVYFNNTVINFTDRTGGALSAGAHILFSTDAASAFNTGQFSTLRLDGSGFVTAGLSIGGGLGNYPGSTLQVVGNNLVLNVVVPAGPPPAAPTSLTVTSGFDQVSVVWPAASGAGSYTVKRSTVSGSGYTDLATGITSTSYADTTATPGVTYYYVVVAVNGNGESPASPEGSGVSSVRATIGLNLRAYNSYGMPVSDLAGVVRKAWWNNLVGPNLPGESVTTTAFTDYLGNPVPGMSATFTAGSSGTGATLELDSDSVTVGPALNDLNLYSAVFDAYNGTPATLSITGIPYASYDFVVYVYDGGASRGGLVTANGATYSIRGGVGNPTVDGVGYVRSTDTVNTSGSAVAQGNYVRFTGLSGPLTASFVAANLGDSVQRLKVAGFQILSNDPNPGPLAAPTTPSGLTASGGNRQVALNWTHQDGVSSYKLFRGGTQLAVVPSPLTAYADTSVSNDTAYSYTLVAVNALGESAPTAAVSATPSAPAFTAEDGAVYQFSILVTAIFSTRAADPNRRAYLWVPPGATRLQGVVVGLHNMLEKPMFEDPAIRQACADEGLAIVFITPGDARTWTPNGVGNYTAGPLTTALDLDPNNYGTPDINPATGVAFANASEQAGAELAEILRRLAVESGYAELEFAPLLMTGHSAASPLVWTRSVANSAALAARVFALLPYKGFFPGSILSGMPILHVASEWQEISAWGSTWDVGDAPSVRNLRAAGAERLLGEVVQPGTGHYHYAEVQAAPIAAFIKAAAALRIPANWTPTAIPTLAAVDPTAGWLVDISTLGSGNATAVPYATWVGAGKDPVRAFWYPDQRTAESACAVAIAGFTKRPQLISAFSNASSMPNLASQSNGEGMVRLTATLQADGYTFQVRGGSLNQSPITKLFHGAPLGIASGPILFKANRSGALRQTGPDTFRVWLDRGSVIKTGQPWEPWVIAYHPGDGNFRSADRPIYLSTSVPVNLTSASGGATQTITFPALPNQSADALGNIALVATSSAGASYPVQFFMIAGPYRTSAANSAVVLPDSVPVGAKFPMRVVVGAWQWGKPGVFQSAEPVLRTFWIFKDAFQKWQWENFGTTDADGVPVLPGAAAGAEVDTAGDGIPNLLKYATNRSPFAPAGSIAEASQAADRLTLTFQRIADAALTYTVEATDDLATSWTTVWTSTGALNTAGPVTVTDAVALTAHPKRFLRLRVAR